jgi:MFS transporter, putative metabolite:H+ symporter
MVKGLGTDRAAALGHRPPGKEKLPGIAYEHPVLFWIAIVMVTAGVCMQLPMFYMGRMNHYHLAGMPFTPEMDVGMVLLPLSIGLTVFSLYPRNVTARNRAAVSKIRVRALDEAPIKLSHILLLLALAVAITIDVMKPVTLSFVVPGTAAEYHLRGPLNPHAHALPVALYPLSGITGTAVGSFVWGWLGDRIGRRASILVAAVIFISVATCGTMPQFWMNLVCCFIMGLGAGGMLPIAFALMSETIPARHRGWLMVLVGGDIAGAYLATSVLASTLAAPDRFGWRIMWLVSLPTGLLLIVLNHWIPESPRYLLLRGRDAAARIVMARYGAEVVEEQEVRTHDPDIKGRFAELFSRPFIVLSCAVLVLALGIGLTQYGLQQWMPTDLQKLGFSSVKASSMLRNSAIFSLPLSLPVALLYGFWSSRKTIFFIAALTSVALAAFAIGGDSLAHHHLLLQILLVVPVWSINILNSVLAAYAVEIYPTAVRSHGSGLAAGVTKFGGVLILAMAVVGFVAPSIRLTAIYGVVPMVLATLAIVIFGPETRRKRLERITFEELHYAEAGAEAR